MVSNCIILKKMQFETSVHQRDIPKYPVFRYNGYTVGYPANKGELVLTPVCSDTTHSKVKMAPWDHNLHNFIDFGEGHENASVKS